MGKIILPTGIGAKIGSRSGLIECTRTGHDQWDLWDERYDGTGMEFSGSDEEIKTLVAESRKVGYDPITNVWKDKFKYQVGRIRLLIDNYMVGAVDQGAFVGELKRLVSLIGSNKCACWRCLGMSDPYADDENAVDGEKKP